MTQQEFQIQIVRIEKQFGGYGAERAIILWKMVEPFSAKWFKQVVDSKLASCRQMPLPAEFQDDISLEREREHQRQKEQNSRDAKNFLTEESMTFPNEEVRDICKEIRKTLTGEKTESESQRYTSLLFQAAITAEQNAVRAKIAEKQGV